ncbi:MAG: type II toxin-antitoxin system VapC family toxin [Prevotellaceae bacterium]|jgi:PIN domain nuclease of toxin-antitoxin system|nr:type II toxin-antitoxin system VapC family toxin [Prevotellaceae bacterium]
MRYYIDTNILIYIFRDKSLLDSSVREIIEDYENSIYISSECVKEFIHLIQNDRINTKQPLKTQGIVYFIKELGYTIKYTTEQHLATLENLPIVSNHNDPNDRLIIAQAITEKIPLISSDTKFEHYKKYNLKFIYNKK